VPAAASNGALTDEQQSMIGYQNRSIDCFTSGKAAKQKLCCGCSSPRERAPSQRWCVAHRRLAVVLDPDDVGEFARDPAQPLERLAVPPQERLDRHVEVKCAVVPA
jgi:hypothetical protein